MSALSLILLDTLWRTSWQAGVLAVCLAAGLHLYPRVPAAARVALWWIVCAKFVAGLAWTSPIALPVLPPSAAFPAASVDRQAVWAPDTAVTATEPDASGDREWTLWMSRWPAPLASGWLCGLFVQGMLAMRQWRQTRVLVAAAHPVSGEPLRSFADLCARAGVRQMPDLRASAHVTTPQVAGVFTPTVLIPATAIDTWPPSELTMTLAHELMHIRRNDLAHGWIPALASRLFFFHPLARYAAREYAIAREAACDAQTVGLLGVPPAEYGQMLVRVGVSAGAPAAAIGTASETLHSLRRRLAMLQDPTRHARRLRWTWLGAVVLIAIVAVPFRMTPRRDVWQATAEAAVSDVSPDITAQAPAEPAVSGPVPQRDPATARRQIVERERDVREQQEAAQLQQQLAAMEAQVKALNTPEARRALAEMESVAVTIDTPEFRRQLAEMEAHIRADAMRDILKMNEDVSRAALARDSQQHQEQQRLNDLDTLKEMARLEREQRIQLEGQVRDLARELARLREELLRRP